MIADPAMREAAPGRPFDPTQAEFLRAEGYFAQVSGSQGIPIFEQIYLQAIGAGVTLLAGAVLLYWIVGLNRKSCDFLIATDNEMKKVNWSTRKQVIGSTWVVIGASFLLAALLFVVDLGFSRFFKLIQVLE
jgi:preprotein translocase SecE subunit